MTELNWIIAFCAVGLVPMAWLLPSRWQLPAVSVLTAGFMLVASPLSAISLFLTASLSYGIFRLSGLTPAWRVVLAICQSIAVWVVFKSEWPVQQGWQTSVGVPLGLSYYTFRQIHYAIERYKQTLPVHSYADYLTYLFFLPTLLIGPINRFPDFYRDSRRRRWDSALFSTGLERILYGYAKIVLIGNMLITTKLGHLIPQLQPHHPALATYLSVVRFATNAYVQFAGFSDIAIGLSLLVGIRVPENFQSPFLASNLNEFWKRYHISLSSWCRDYVFTPLLSLTRQPVLATLGAMLVLGLWHEWSSQYVVWGVLQGLGVLIWRQFKRPSGPASSTVSWASARHWLGVLATFHYFCFTCIIIQKDNWQAVGQTLAQLFVH
ncbi:MBOAT family O-acyltransferase [Spirosoma gilvum]